MPRLIVEGLGVAEAAVGQTMLEACDRAGLTIETDCGGFAACNSCRVAVLSGAEQLSPLDKAERPFLDRPDQRLGCQARLEGSGEVRVRLEPGN